MLIDGSILSGYFILDTLILYPTHSILNLLSGSTDSDSNFKEYFLRIRRSVIKSNFYTKKNKSQKYPWPEYEKERDIKGFTSHTQLKFDIIGKP